MPTKDSQNCASHTAVLFMNASLAFIWKIMPSIIDIRTNMFAGGVLYGYFMFIYRFSSESLNLPWWLAYCWHLCFAVAVASDSTLTFVLFNFYWCYCFLLGNAKQLFVSHSGPWLESVWRHVSAGWIWIPDRSIVSFGVDLAYFIYKLFFLYSHRVAVDLFNLHLVYGRGVGCFWPPCLPNSFGTLQI